MCSVLKLTTPSYWKAIKFPITGLLQSEPTVNRDRNQFNECKRRIIKKCYAMPSVNFYQVNKHNLL